MLSINHFLPLLIGLMTTGGRVMINKYYIDIVLDCKKELDKIAHGRNGRRFTRFEAETLLDYIVKLERYTAKSIKLSAQIPYVIRDEDDN